MQTMKISTQHLDQLKEGLVSFFAKEEITPTQLAAVYKAENLSDTRFYWDCFWNAGIHSTCDFQQADYVDSHITTAIKKAFKDQFNFTY